MDEQTASASQLHGFCLAALQAMGTPDELSQVVAEALVGANLAGHDSHGLARLPAYAQTVRDGKLHPDARASVVRRRGATASVSAHRGWGQPAARLAADTAADLAREQGVGAIVLQESPHVGRLGDYAERIATAGQLSMVVTNAWVSVAPFGGRDRRLGTNPIAFGVPRAAPRPPIVSDFATSVVAEGKLQVARAYGRSVPPGTIVDSDGRPTEDPNAFYDGGALLPAQGYKGYGLAVAIEALGAEALLLVAAAVGFFFYVIGGALGERFGRQRVLIASAICSTVLTLAFYWVHVVWAIWVLYVFLYQVTNGTWSGTGYAYWAESFPTRVRGTAVGWLGAMFTGGLIIGSGIWTILIGSQGARTMLIVGGGFAVLQLASTFLLPHIRSGQELEEVAT